MFNAIGNNFGAGEIRFKSYQQPTYAILNTRFFMDTTSPEYQAADVLEITVPKLSIDRSTDSVALIVSGDRVMGLRILMMQVQRPVVGSKTITPSVLKSWLVWKGKVNCAYISIRCISS